jgi:hypothetical protein
MALFNAPVVSGFVAVGIHPWSIEQNDGWF